MNFLLIIVCCCIFLNVEAKTKLWKCSQNKTTEHANKTYRIGIVCTSISCDWSIDPTCKNGTYSKVLKWETDIFEIGFIEPARERAREVVVQIKLNDDYYIRIDVNSDKEKRSVTIFLNECAYAKNCSENQRKTYTDVNITGDTTFVAIGFRKDKKINFATENDAHNIATNRFGPDNEYELKMPGFYFNTSETMYITVYSKFDAKYRFNGVLMYLPTSVGGIFFNDQGYLTNNYDFTCLYYYNISIYYNTSDDLIGLPYVIREYFNNSENWKAPPVNYTLPLVVPYFDENGMKVKSQDKMKVKEEKNPNFDEKNMKRIGCIYAKIKFVTVTLAPVVKDEFTFTDFKFVEATTPFKVNLETAPKLDTKMSLPDAMSIGDVTLIKKDDPSDPDINITELKFVTVTLAPVVKDEFTFTDFKLVETTTTPFKVNLENTPKLDTKVSLPEEMSFGDVTLIKKNDPSDPDININDFIDSVGKDFFDPDYLNALGTGDDLLMKLKNKSEYNLHGYKRKEAKKKKKTSGKKNNKTFGSGGSGDASRGRKQVKIISQKYIVILILMNLSVKRLVN